MVSTGNEAVVGLEDFLAELIDDDATRVITLFVEQIRLADKTKLMNAPRSKRGEGRRPVMPTALEIRKEQGAHWYPAHLAKPVVNTK